LDLIFCIDKWLWVTCYTQPCKPCKVTCILHYLPLGDESSPRGEMGYFCAGLTWGINIIIVSWQWRIMVWVNVGGFDHPLSFRKFPAHAYRDNLLPMEKNLKAIYISTSSSSLGTRDTQWAKFHSEAITHRTLGNMCPSSLSWGLWCNKSYRAHERIELESINASIGSRTLALKKCFNKVPGILHCSVDRARGTLGCAPMAKKMMKEYHNSTRRKSYIHWEMKERGWAWQHLRQALLDGS
jgi:hypothetical protein